MEASDWRDISTAPKDGTRFLAIARQEDILERYAVIYWRAFDHFEYVSAGNGLFRKTQTSHSWWEGAHYSPFDATHWMPLPNPPEAV